MFLFAFQLFSGIAPSVDRECELGYNSFVLDQKGLEEMNKKPSGPVAEFFADADWATYVVIGYVILWSAAFFDMKPIRMPEEIKEQIAGIQLYERIEISVDHGVELARECAGTQRRKGPACQGLVALTKSMTELFLAEPRMREIVLEREFRDKKTVNKVFERQGLLNGAAREVERDSEVVWKDSW